MTEHPGLPLGASQSPRPLWREAGRPDTPAPGAEPLAASLARRSHEDVLFLHDRAMPHASSTIDHLAIAPGGVWVIAAARVAGEARIVGRGAGQELWIGNHDHTSLLERVAEQVAAVGAVVEQLAPDVRAFGALCLAETELPVFRTLTMHGVPICWANGIAKRLSVAGPVDHAWAELLSAELATAFPPRS